MADKLWTIVQKLNERTKVGKVNWERTAKENVYQASFPSYTVRIFPRHSQDPNQDEPDYIVQIVNEEGALVEEASDVDLRDTAGVQNTFILMKGLHEVARRKAMGVEKALDILLHELDRDPPS